MKFGHVVFEICVRTYGQRDTLTTILWTPTGGEAIRAYVIPVNILHYVSYEMLSLIRMTTE